MSSNSDNKDNNIHNSSNISNESKKRQEVTKSDDKIETSARFDMGKMKKKCLKYPLSKLEDCNLIHYQLQLSLYAWLVKQINPDFNIVSLEIMHIKDGKLKKVYPVEYLEKEIVTLLKWHLKATKLKKETDKCKELKF